MSAPQLQVVGREVLAGSNYQGRAWRAVPVTDLAGLHGAGRFAYWLVDVGNGLEVWVLPARVGIGDALDAQIVVHRFTARQPTDVPVPVELAARLARRAHADLHTPVPSFDEVLR